MPESVFMPGRGKVWERGAAVRGQKAEWLRNAGQGPELQAIGLQPHRCIYFSMLMLSDLPRILDTFFGSSYSLNSLHKIR